MYTFLSKCKIREFICNHYTDCNELAHMARIAYSVFPLSATGEALFTLMPTLFKVLLPKFRYMGDDTSKIDLYIMG